VKLVYFVHSVTSCWNNGNAHFQRGVLRALGALGVDAVAAQPAQSWSEENLLAEAGPAGSAAFRDGHDDLACSRYASVAEAEKLAADADAVIVHEWNEPALVAALGAMRRRGACGVLLFHDTHHRAVSDPAAIRHFDLDGYDGILAFGATLAEIYRRWGWGARAFVWHEAADVTLFRPPTKPSRRAGLVWIGNWGEGERAEELRAFLLEPARQAALPLDVFGVRYPPDALAALAQAGARYHGWAANVAAPALFAAHVATVHVPRRFYVRMLPGIPTIRVFEALACGIPLVCAPWSDAEGLFRPGEDFLVADTPADMRRHLVALRDDPGLRSALAASGLATIAARHTCRHRAAELLGIVERIEGGRVTA
jgi:spore maturation protein CgeB